MKKSHAILVVLVAVAIVLGGIGFLARGPPGTLPTRTTVSYNSGIAAKFHAPLSSRGAAAVNQVMSRLPQAGLASTPLPDAQIASIPANGVRFINDTSYVPQGETTVAVDPTNINHVVGGANDFRDFYCFGKLPPADCPSGIAFSGSVFTVSTDGGRTVLKGDDLPGLTVAVRNRTGTPFPEFLESFGDPSLVAGVSGNFYYAALAISSNSSANGIQLAVSNAGLFNPSVNCTTPSGRSVSNPCWTTTFVAGNLTDFAGTFEDKELVAVDRNTSSPFYGYAYVSWDHFTPFGTTESWVAQCDPTLACTMIAGGGPPPLNAADPYPAFTTPAVGSDGAAYFMWCNYGTATTLGPISCRVRSTGPGGGAFGAVSNILSFDGAGTTLPNDLAVVGFATEQFRTDSIPVLSVDTSTLSNNLYFTIATCTAGDYYHFYGPVEPGNCGHSSIRFSRSLDGGATWSAPSIVSAPAVNIQPWVTTDPLNGAVVVAYYTTQFDPFDHRIDVVASVSTDQGQTFRRVRATNVSNEPNADPGMFNYTAPLGSALFAPQFGDYMQAVALGGTIWALFNANYAVEHGTFQLDPWLVLTPESSPLTVAATFNPPLADPGLPVTFTAKTTNAAGATAYAWTFGDSATGTGVSPTHAYSGTGKYTVQVTATDYLGRMATDIVKITVSTVLNATASAKPAVTDAGQNVSFAAIAAGGAGGYTYKWAFGDGGTSAVSSPIHVYAAAGAYSVNAWVNDSAGGSIARGFTVMVNAIPSVALSVSPSATDVGMALHFTSTVSGGTAPFRYAWDFKDASSSTAVAPAHSYGQAGSYSVELVVTDAVKVAAVSSISVTLNGRPVAAAKASNSAPAVGNAVGFTGSVTDGTGPFTYAWAFGDGASSSTQNSSHGFSGPGTYSVRLWVNDSVGGSSLATIIVVVSASGLSTTTAVIFSTVAFLVGVIATAIVLIAIARRRKKEEPAVAPPPPAEEKEDTIPPP